MKSSSLKSKALLWFGGIIFIIILLFSLSFRYILNNSINSNIKSSLDYQAKEILEEIKSSDYKDLKSKNIEFIVYKDKKLLYKSKNFPTKKLLNRKKSFYTFQNSKNDEAIDAIYILNDKNYKVIVYKSNIDNKIENLDDTLLVLVPLLLLVLLIVASKLIDRVLLPIKTLTKSAKNISIHNFQRKIDMPKASSEIIDLIDSFNTMIERIQEGVANLDRFNSDLSHELKTPLTVIRGKIEVALKKNREAKEYKEALESVLKQTMQLEAIINNLLLLSRYTKENIASTFRLCTFDTILLNCIEKFDSMLEEKNITLHIEPLEHIQSYSNQVLLEAIFNNLIDNAIKYSTKNSNIYISLYQKNGINFTIKDEGIGIAKEELSKITNRFYRVDKSRNKLIEGFGLGLAIVKNSIDLLGGEFKIESKLNSGTKIYIKFL